MRPSGTGLASNPALDGLRKGCQTEQPNPKLEPQPGPQTDFLASKADITIYGGAAGGGKSYGLLLRPYKHLKNVKGFGSVIFRRTSPQIRNEGGLWDTSEEIYLGAAKPRESVLEWELGNGNQIKFAHMQYEKDRLDWQGSQIAHIGFDELTHFTESQFWYMQSRNRSTAGVKPFLDATCNPVPPSDPIGGWVHSLIGWWIGGDGYVIAERCNKLRWFIRVSGELVWAGEKEDLLERYPDSLPRSITFIEASLEDNRVLLEKDPGYKANLQNLPETDRQQLLDRNWLAEPSNGKIFKEIAFKRCTSDEVPELLEIVCIVDPAVTSTNNSDSQGIVIDGVTPDRQHLYALYSWEGVLDPTECIRRAIVQALRHKATSIMFETNQGGDLWKSQYDFVWEEMLKSNDYPEVTADTRRPKYEETKQSKSTGSKIERWNGLVSHYEMDRITHVIGTHEARERAYKRIPEYTPYDLADAGEMGARRLLAITPKRKRRTPSRSQKGVVF